MKPQFFVYTALMMIAMVAVTQQVQSAPGGLAPAAVQLLQAGGEAGGDEAGSSAEQGVEPQEAPATPSEVTPDGWEVVATGIHYKKFHLPDPNNVFVARMDRNEPSATIESSMALGRISGAKEPVSGMAWRFDQSINYWGKAWGGRNRVAVAVNGYYYNGETGEPAQGQVHSGWYAKRFDDCQTGSGGSGFAWKFDRSAFIGGTISHPETKQYVSFANGETQLFNGINLPRGKDSVILYTPQYGAVTGAGTDGVELLVEMRQPNLLSLGAATGVVREIRRGQAPSAIPFDHVVISAQGLTSGSPGIRLFNNVRIGEEVGIYQRIKSFVDGCGSDPSPIDWSETYASIGGAFLFLEDGQLRTYAGDAGATARHPRTAIAFNDAYVFFIVVDGRDPFMSVGMTIEELARFARDTLAATWGIAEDGGGSSTMVVNGRVVNNTYCNNVFCRSKVFLPSVTGGNAAEEERAAQAEGQPSPLSPVAYPAGQDSELVLTPMVERLVPNGLMMVVVEPAEKSKTYAAGDRVKTLAETTLRLGPGSNYPPLATLGANAEGIILAHFNQLDGVLAKGSYWWKAAFGNATGWVAEEALGKVTP